MTSEVINTEFSTKDLHLAAYLRIKEAQLLRVEKPDIGFKSPSFFIFLDREKCEALNKKFWEEGDYINIKEYMMIVRELRSQVSSIPYEKKV